MKLIKLPLSLLFAMLFFASCGGIENEERDDNWSVIDKWKNTSVQHEFYNPYSDFSNIFDASILIPGSKGSTISFTDNGMIIVADGDNISHGRYEMDDTELIMMIDVFSHKYSYSINGNTVRLEIDKDGLVEWIRNMPNDVITDLLIFPGMNQKEDLIRAISSQSIHYNFVATYEIIE